MRTLLLLLISMVTVARDATAQDTQCVLERAAMVETIRAYARSHVSILGQQGLSERVLEAMWQTQRHLFIPERSCSIAYADMPLPIGVGQTISQPFIVALMTQLANVAPDDVVLEVGTGSGYQAAILAHLARKVCTIEIIPQLAEVAAKTLKDLAYDNVSVRLGDGYAGWPDCGPFDEIIVTAALGQVPPPLIEQLKVGGRSVELERLPFGHRILEELTFLILPYLPFAGLPNVDDRLASQMLRFDFGIVQELCHFPFSPLRETPLLQRGP